MNVAIFHLNSRPANLVLCLNLLSPFAASFPPVKSQAVIALDLGGTNLRSALFAPDGRRSFKRTIRLESTPRARAHDVGQTVVSHVCRLQQAASRRNLNVAAIGVCVPGIVVPKTDRVWAPNIPGWDNYPLTAEIQAAAANPKVKVIVESDRAASILGEAWLGAARGCRDAIFLAVGTGIGAGILAGGRVLGGAHGIAGAIGWLALDRPFRPEYVGCGCFESHASGEGLARVAKELLARKKSYRGALGKKSDLTAHDVFAEFQRGDPIAQEVIQQAIEFWGMASANLISLFNPEKLVFGGGVFGPATKFLDVIKLEARRWAQPIAFQRTAFEASQLGSDAALCGAAYIALREARLQKPLRPTKNS